MTMRNKPVQVIPGYNTDRIDVEAGMKMLARIGYDDGHTQMVINYALLRWARGEEYEAERNAIDLDYHGIPMTQWRMVLAAARAGGEASA